MKVLVFSLSILFSSCLIKEQSPISTSDTDANLIKSGDIVVVNGGNDSIVLLDKDGNFKQSLYSISTSATISFPALAWDAPNNRLLFTYDSTTAADDKIMAISPYDLSVTTIYNNSAVFTATGLNGIARLTGGDLIGIEAATTMEKFDSSWNRVGAPFMNATLISAAADVAAMSDGGFVVASTATANTIRTYDSAGTTVASATSAVPAPSLGAAVSSSGVVQASSGKIIAAFSGATDGVRQYSSDLATVDWNFINTAVLTTPGKIAVRANGNALVLDTAFNHIVEINPTGGLVRVIGASLLATPSAILVIP